MDLPEDWARRLLSESNELRTVAHLPAIFTRHREVREAIHGMFRRFDEKAIPNARMWVDGGQRYTITDSLIALATHHDLDLERHLATAARTSNFCVTLNGLTAWCERFALDMQGQMLSPLFRALGEPPQRGVDFYAFFGNYGFTPFGVHDDIDHSLLWHLGPAKKTAYVWPRDAYMHLTGGLVSTPHYTDLLPHSLRFDLQPGDLLFIPKGDFHIFETGGFSATLGLTLFPADPLQDCTEGLRLLIPDTQALNRHASVAFTTDTLITLSRLALESNGHVIVPPALRMTSDRNTAVHPDHRSMLRTHPCWPLRHMTVGDRDALLVRGRPLWGAANSILEQFTNAISSGTLFPYSDLETHMSDVISPEAFGALVRKLNKLGGITIERT